MRHPFELELSELETIDFQLQELTDEASEKVSGGSLINQPVGRKENIHLLPSPPVKVTTAAAGEEGGTFVPISRILNIFKGKIFSDY